MQKMYYEDQTFKKNQRKSLEIRKKKCWIGVDKERQDDKKD